MTTPAAIKRLEVIISGVAHRTVSAVDSLVEELRATGMGDKAINQRVQQELESGPVLAEMRRFATARAPGVMGDMVFRFARDTTALEARRAKDIAMFKQIAADQKAADATPMTDEQLAAVEKTAREQNIDASAFLADEMPVPPADDDPEALYLWVAVEDRNTCETCAGNHGEVKTMSEWTDIGEPRAGACAGGENCRCVLVPTEAMTAEQRQKIVDAGPIEA